MTEHVGLHNEVRDGGIVHVCSCGWISRPCFSSIIASNEGQDHRDREAGKTSAAWQDLNDKSQALTEALNQIFLERKEKTSVCVDALVNMLAAVSNSVENPKDREILKLAILDELTRQFILGEDLHANGSWRELAKS